MLSGFVVSLDCTHKKYTPIHVEQTNLELSWTYYIKGLIKFTFVCHIVFIGKSDNVQSKSHNYISGATAVCRVRFSTSKTKTLKVG